jgi:hypothetical protein
MNVRFLLAVTALAAISGPLGAQEQRRAALRGGGGNQGKCTIEVVVDGAAEVEIHGDSAMLRTTAGLPAQWRRFECSAPMPANPPGFRFSGVDGRGRQDLIRDPRNGGAAVVRIEDPQGGSEGYTFDVTWDNRGGYPDTQDRNRRDERDRPPISRRFTTDEAVRVCQDSVRRQAMERFRTQDIVFRRTALDDNPGRNDWVVGSLEARRGGRTDLARFSCSVNFDNGQVRSAQIDPMEERREGRSNSQALQSCQRAVEERVRRDGYSRADFTSINVDDRPGRNDWIIGRVKGEGRGRWEEFEFSCSVNLENGVVRSVDLRRR